MMLTCLIWLLGLCSLSAGVPVNSVNRTAAASGNYWLHPATNQTSEVTSQSGGSQNVSGETLADLQNDVAVEEGDILVTEDRNAVNRIWSNAVVPYVISAEVAYRKVDIEAAFNMIMSLTCIRFQERTNEMNYIEIKSGQGCGSYVGCRGGSQPLFFDNSCSKGNLCHELIHSLGMYHEHTRQDRDGYITVNWGSIMPDRKDNFDIKPGNTLNLPYDYDSIMHYGMSYFSANGSPTIVTRGGATIGQRTHLSQLDVQKLNALYHCGGWK